MSGCVDPYEIPYVNPVGGSPVVDVGAIRGSASALTRLAVSLGSAGEDTVQAWSGITACYRGPGQETVWEAMVPVGPAVDEVSSHVGQVAEAVSGFADEIEPIITQLTQLKSEAESLVADINSFTPHVAHDWSSVARAGLWGGAVGAVLDVGATAIGTRIESWDQDPGLVGRNNDLVHQINDQVGLYEQAERRCANTIDAVYGGTQWHVTGAAFGDPSSAYGWDEAGLDSSDEPWGSTVEVQESGATKAIMFLPNLVSGIGEGAYGLVGGLLSLVSGLYGVSVQRGTMVDGEVGVQVGGWALVFSPQTQAQTGEDLLDTVAGLMAGLGPTAGVAGLEQIPEYDFDTGQWSHPTAAQITTGVGKSLVDWDEWSRDPGTAAGETITTAATFFLPGIGPAGRGASAADDAARIEDATDVVDAAEDTTRIEQTVRAGETVDAGGVSDAVDVGGAVGVDRFTIPEVTEPVPDPLIHPEPTPDPGLAHPQPEPVHPQPDPAPAHPGSDPDPGVEPHRSIDEDSVPRSDSDGGASQLDHPTIAPNDDAAGISSSHIDDGVSRAGSDVQTAPIDEAGHSDPALTDSTAHNGDDAPSDVDAGSHPSNQIQDSYPPPSVTNEVTWDSSVGPRTPFSATSNLEPNTLYHVEGRGDFYTDVNGEVHYVDTQWGSVGARNPDLMHPTPDTTYVIHRGDEATYVYQTDSQSRTILGGMDNYHPVAGAERSDAIQARIGHLGGEGYQGGHLIAASRGAGAEDIGTVPQLTSLNTGGGDYWNLEKDLDDTWHDLQRTDPGSTIDFRVKMDYTGDSRVPDSFVVRYRINGGEWTRRIFPNV